MPTTEESERQFATEVFPAELAEIVRRRERLGLGPPGATTPPSTANDLVGLALSGGGIRCASLSLGVLQSMIRAGVLRRVDYLSTVSGGGLIGSCLSALLSSPDCGPDQGDNPLAFEAGAPERPAVSYLRDHGSWLAPGGLLDKVRIPTLVLRGIINNLVLLVPLLVIAVCLTEVLFAIGWRVGRTVIYALPPVLAAAFLGAILVQPLLYRLMRRRFDWQTRDRYEAFLALSLVLLLATLTLIPAVLLIEEAIDLSWHDVVSQWHVWLRTGIVWVGLALVISVFALAGKASQAMSQWTGRMALLLLGLLGPVLVLAGFLLLTLYQVDSPVLDVATVEAGPVSGDLRRAMADKGIELGEEATVIAGAQRSWTIVDGDSRHVIRRDATGRFVLQSLLLWDGVGDAYFLLAGVLALLYGLFFANPNLTSPRGFFRDRMSRAFLFVVRDGRIEPRDELRLSELNPAGSAAPYHLINATLNLSGSSDPDLRGRNSDFFLFSRHFCGGPRTTYCPTTRLERFDSHLDLGTAMAISGAGLAPNMGTTTVKPLVFLLALLNLRLGYWLANPDRVRASSALRRIRLYATAGPGYMLLEALGKLDARHAYVNVSDGGHLENMGIYELLRRRCKWIVAVDGEEDPERRFGGLLQLMRFARIDLGVEVRIELDALRPGADGHSTAHWALGEIDYGQGQLGHLIYLKSSITGDEEEYVRDYGRSHPSFPQESSADQFFTEAQFEAYRALGEHMAKGVFESVEVRWPESPPWRDGSSTDVG